MRSEWNGWLKVVQLWEGHHKIWRLVRLELVLGEGVARRCGPHAVAVIEAIASSKITHVKFTLSGETWFFFCVLFFIIPQTAKASNLSHPSIQ